MTAAEFELLADAEAECLLRRRLRTFLAAGADPCEALILAAQVEVSEDAVVELLRQGALTPRMADVSPFERLPEALAALGERAVAGKGVIAIGADVLVDAS